MNKDTKKSETPVQIREAILGLLEDVIAAQFEEEIMDESG